MTEYQFLLGSGRLGSGGLASLALYVYSKKQYIQYHTVYSVFVFTGLVGGVIYVHVYTQVKK